MQWQNKKAISERDRNDYQHDHFFNFTITADFYSLEMFYSENLYS